MTDELEILSPYEDAHIWLNRAINHLGSVGFYCVHYDPHRNGGSYISTRGALNGVARDYLRAWEERSLNHSQNERLFVGDVTHTRITKAPTLQETRPTINRVANDEYQHGYGLPDNWHLYFNPEKRALYMHIKSESVRDGDSPLPTQSNLRKGLLTDMVEAFERGRSGSNGDWF